MKYKAEYESRKNINERFAELKSTGLTASAGCHLRQQIGKAGHIYYLNARGIDNSEVIPDRERKSLGAEETFMSDIGNKPELEERLRGIADEVWQRTSKREFYGRTVTLKVKYADFTEVSKRRTLTRPIEDFNILWDISLDLLAAVEFSQNKRIRLLGLYISNIMETNESEDRQLKLNFGEDETENDSRNMPVMIKEHTKP